MMRRPPFVIFHQKILIIMHKCFAFCRKIYSIRLATWKFDVL